MLINDRVKFLTSSVHIYSICLTHCFIIGDLHVKGIFKKFEGVVAALMLVPVAQTSCNPSLAQSQDLQHSFAFILAITDNNQGRMYSLLISCYF